MRQQAQVGEPNCSLGSICFHCYVLFVSCSKYLVRASYLQIYNEVISDLLKVGVCLIKLKIVLALIFFRCITHPRSSVDACTSNCTCCHSITSIASIHWFLYHHTYHPVQQPASGPASC